MNNLAYSERVARELDNYTKVLSEGGVISSIPPILSYWACTHLTPRLLEVFGTGNISEIYVNEVCEVAKDIPAGEQINILSLGSGDCTTEFEIIDFLKKRGIFPLIYCTEINPVVVESAKNKATQLGVGQQFKFHICDLNEHPLPQQTGSKGGFHAVIVNHSLHHFVGLENIFSNVESVLHEKGVFVVHDMIGRNGHMRWPEALGFVEALWDYLPPDKKYNNHAKVCDEGKYINYDCTSGGDFEGVRAQDIFPLLYERFAFSKFVGYGNIPDFLIDRTYGPNFSPDKKEDTKLIDLAEKLNSELIDRGVIKPTMMTASMKKKVQGKTKPCKFSRWSPESCVRQPT